MRLLLLASFLVLTAIPAARASDQEQAPAHIAVVDGRATLQREGRADVATSGMPLVAGDRVRTEEGRVEVLLGDGSILDLDRHTTVDWQSEAIVRLIQGRIFLTVATIEQGTKFIPYRVDTAGGIVQVHAPGEYRIAALESPGGADVDLAVLRGAAELTNDAGRMRVDAGQRALVRAGAAPSYPQPFNSAMWDAFDRWTAERRQARAGSTSPRYLPSELYSYSGVFDRYGTWRQEATHGYVWYPYTAAGWRPYMHGRWNYVDPYGWTWIASDPWGWPTHHFGRWGVSGGSWFWIPARRWGSAWVHWAVAPGYVAWCPLGWDNRPLVNISAFNRVDRFRVPPGFYDARGVYDPWYAWNVVPFDRFRSRATLGPLLVDGRRLGSDVRSRFVMQGIAPLNREQVSQGRDPATASAGRIPATASAVPRGTVAAPASQGMAPGRTRGQRPRMAVPRSAAPRSPADLGPGGPTPTPSPGPSELPPDRGARAVPVPAPTRVPDSASRVAVPRAPQRRVDPSDRAPESPRVRRPAGGDDPGRGSEPRGRSHGGEARPRGGAGMPAPPPVTAPPPSSPPPPPPPPGPRGGAAVPRGGARPPQ